MWNIVQFEKRGDLKSAEKCMRWLQSKYTVDVDLGFEGVSNNSSIVLIFDVEEYRTDVERVKKVVST